MIKTIYKLRDEKPSEFYGRLKERWNGTVFAVRIPRPDP